MFVEGNSVGHALLLEIGGCVREDVVGKRYVTQEQQEVESRYCRTSVYPCPIFRLLEDTSSYRLTQVPVCFKNVFV
jgi:hypothetical protein